jgi:hypothetical protein
MRQLETIRSIYCTIRAKGGNKPAPVPQPNHVVWVDANGVILGDAQTYVDTEIALIFFDVEGVLYSAHQENGAFSGHSVIYDRVDCLGTAYGRDTSIKNGAVELKAIRDGVFYLAESNVPQTVNRFSIWSEWEQLCWNLDTPDFQDDYYPIAPFLDTNIYTKPIKLKLIPANLVQGGLRVAFFFAIIYSGLYIHAMRITLLFVLDPGLLRLRQGIHERGLLLHG